MLQYESRNSALKHSQIAYDIVAHLVFSHSKRTVIYETTVVSIKTNHEVPDHDSDNGIMKCGLTQLSDDEAVDIIFDYVSTIKSIDSIILYVDISYRHRTTQDEGIDPSSSSQIVIEGEVEENNRDDNCSVLGISICNEVHVNKQLFGLGDI